MSRYVEVEALEKRAVLHVIGIYGYSAKAEDWAVPIKAIREAPTVNVRPIIYAKWVALFSDGIDMIYKCSRCGRLITAGAYSSEIIKEYPYCHCGAEMNEVIKDGD